MTQTIIVIIIVGLSACYLGLHIWRSLTGADDPCKGCEGCALRDRKKSINPSDLENPPCKDKKMKEKFGH